MDYKNEYEKHTRAEWAESLNLLPPHMVGGMVRYIVHGIPAGSFLNAVLSGDLFEALRRADDVNMNELPNYARFLINSAPCGCYGSPSAVAEWVKLGGLAKMNLEATP